MNSSYKTLLNCLIIAIVISIVTSVKAATNFDCKSIQPNLTRIYNSIELLDARSLKGDLESGVLECVDVVHQAIVQLTIADARGDAELIIAQRKKVMEQNLLNKADPYYLWQLYAVLQSYYWDGMYQAALDFLNSQNVVVGSEINSSIEARLYFLIGDFFWNADSELRQEADIYYELAKQYSERFGTAELKAFVRLFAGGSIPLRDEEPQKDFERKKQEWTDLISQMPDSVTKGAALTILASARSGNTMNENLAYIQQAINIFKRFDNVRNQIEAEILLTELLIEDEALQTANLKLKAILETYQLSRYQKLKVYESLFENNQSLERYKDALAAKQAYYDTAMETDDDLGEFDFKLANYKIMEQKTKAQALEQSVKLMELEATNAKQRMVNLFLLLSLLLLTIAFLAVLIVKKEKAKKKFQELASTDALTQANNRRAILEMSQREIEVSKRTKLPVTIAIADIDNFKNINDTFGHDVGDEVLKLFADASEKSIRSIDYFGRYGGEEWLFVLPSTDENEAKILFDRISNRLEQSELAKKLSGITFSMGAVAQRNSSDTLQSLIQKADAHMYLAKRAGKNKFIAEFDAAVNELEIA